jgi:GntR family transcriptional regulator
MYHFKIDKTNSKPIYQQIKEQLINAIDQGELQPGNKIPSARDLAEQFGVSRMTVLQALRELSVQGQLFAVTGKGTFVGRAKKLEQNIRTVWGFTDTFQKQGYQTGSQLIHFLIVAADPSAAKALKIPERTPLFQMMRKRLLDDQPVGIETTHLVKSDFPGLEQIDWNNQSLYSVLRTRYNMDLVCGYNYIEAAAADEATARLLAIPKNTPVLATERITCLKDMRPVEFVRAIYRADRLRLKVEMTTDSPANFLATKNEER